MYRTSSLSSCVAMSSRVCVFSLNILVCQRLPFRSYTRSHSNLTRDTLLYEKKRSSKRRVRSPQILPAEQRGFLFLTSRLSEIAYSSPTRTLPSYILAVTVTQPFYFRLLFNLHLTHSILKPSSVRVNASRLVSPLGVRRVARFAICFFDDWAGPACPGSPGSPASAASAAKPSTTPSPTPLEHNAA